MHAVVRRVRFGSGLVPNMSLALSREASEFARKSAGLSRQPLIIAMAMNEKKKAKVVHVIDAESGTESKVKLRNQASLSDYLRNAGIGFLRDAESNEALYTDDFEDFEDGKTYIFGPQKTEQKIRIMQRERTNVIKGEEEELSEALLQLFEQKGIYLDSRPELRAMSRREVDAVLVGEDSVVIAFLCTKLDEDELQNAFDTVSGMQKEAALGDNNLEYLLDRNIYVAQMATWIPPEKLSQLEQFAHRKKIFLLKKNGSNFAVRDPTPVQAFV